MFAFSKYSGLGNDFVFIDNRNLFFPVEKELIQWICHRQLGIGADGVVLLQNSKYADYQMRIFNADGSEAEMCGNALRCLYLFLEELQIEGKSFLIETFDRKLQISRQENLICCEMGEVSDLELNKKVLLSNQIYKGHFVNTGVPHFVIIVDDIEKIKVEELGRALSFHEDFGPDRCNVNFISIKEDQIHIRTYERGVEKETLACGTGAAAAAVIAYYILKKSSPTLVKTRLGSFLKFSFEYRQGELSHLKMIGPANYVFRGEMSFKKVLK